MSKRLPEMNGGKIQHGKIGAIPRAKSVNIAAFISPTDRPPNLDAPAFPPYSRPCAAPNNAAMGWEARLISRSESLGRDLLCAVASATTGRAHGTEPSGAAVGYPVLPLCHVPAHAFRACRAGIPKAMLVEAIMNILSFYRQHPRPTQPTAMFTAMEDQP